MVKILSGVLKVDLRERERESGGPVWSKPGPAISLGNPIIYLRNLQYDLRPLLYFNLLSHHKIYTEHTIRPILVCL